MALAFNFTTKVATHPAGVVAMDVPTAYDEIKVAQAGEQGILHPPIAIGAGGFDLGGGRTSGLIVQMLNSWQVEFTNAGQLTVDGGTLIGGIAGQPIKPRVDQQIILNRPADAFAVSTSGGTAPSAAENAAAVWAHLTAVTMAARLGEVWGRLGLDLARPLTNGTTSITFGDIVLALSEAGGAVTVTRQ